MSNNIKKAQKAFLAKMRGMPEAKTKKAKLYYAMDNSLQATLRRSKTYKTENPKQRFEFREGVIAKVESLSEQYLKKSVSENKHIKNIEDLSESMSKKYGAYLVGKRFRIGSAQKVLNLYLKYLWCLGKIDEPPHFSIDAIMLRELPKYSHISWTKLNNIDKYRDIIKEAKNVAGDQSLAEWELCAYNKN